MPGRKSPPTAFLYPYRTFVERLDKLRHFRAVVTRFKKHSESYHALVKRRSSSDRVMRSRSRPSRRRSDAQEGVQAGARP